MPGHLVQQAECSPQVDADGIETRITIDRSCGCAALVQSVVSFPIGRSQRSAMAGHEQSLFVLSGSATLYLDGQGHHELEPDTAAYIASGESYSIENDGPGPLVAVVVDAPTPADADAPALGTRRVTVSFATQPDQEAGIGRTFRLLVDPD
ncbi:MAG TPA: cupin domain-containing protein, partial [Gaiellales bacterium]|nr:cupin domain-containing protein [Gaiellales bacterium]